VPSVGHVKHTQRGEKESDKEMKTKIASIFAILLIALAVAGFSYAWWTETLTIDGSVSTGKLDVAFENIGITLSEYMTGAAEGIDTDSDGDYDKINVTIGNGYPCGWANVTFNITNTGTIPAKCTNITITAASELTATLNGIAKGDTIAAGDTKSCELTIHVKETADENASYTITVTIDFGQFNA